MRRKGYEHLIFDLDELLEHAKSLQRTSFPSGPDYERAVDLNNLGHMVEALAVGVKVLQEQVASLQAEVAELKARK